MADSGELNSEYTYERLGGDEMYERFDVMSSEQVRKLRSHTSYMSGPSSSSLQKKAVQNASIAMAMSKEGHGWSRDGGGGIGGRGAEEMFAQKRELTMEELLSTATGKNATDALVKSAAARQFSLPLLSHF
eukprot:CAMPEP_0113898578 /NCGR_PEP_ID=MMETSP0780_2-20120614/19476_1 /TAXON_ID=652834 /ORGANISM="Palpitomonas bilix" /LENGTH=130 /DNA_ID=CAMNT_0000890495 /DNA_START=21 /DNA_END=413 /DNA_ORIENTATION=+ /assembly_acc=CAM_ASM_000599